MANKEAIEYLKLFHGYDLPIQEAFKKAIEALKQNQWVPCSERLPEKDECVFVYLFADSPYIAWYDGVDWWCTSDFALEKDEEPIAWMPLPEPYKGEQNDNKHI